MEDTFFNFYGIPTAFFPDEKLIKQKYLEFGKKYHPDFFTLEDDAKQQEMLELSSWNNKAYTTLSKYENRVQYILGLFFTMDEEGLQKMDTDFLLEMMDFNEKLADAQLENDKVSLTALSLECEEKIASMDADIKSDMIAFDQGNSQIELLERIRDYYFRRKYILRVRENIANFAGL